MVVKTSCLSTPNLIFYSSGCSLKTHSSVQEQKGLTNGTFYIQLDPFAAELTHSASYSIILIQTQGFLTQSTSSARRQKDLTTSHWFIQLDPFAFPQTTSLHRSAPSVKSCSVFTLLFTLLFTVVFMLLFTPLLGIISPAASSHV